MHKSLNNSSYSILKVFIKVIFLDFIKTNIKIYPEPLKKIDILKGSGNCNRKSNSYKPKKIKILSQADKKIVA